MADEDRDAESFDTFGELTRKLIQVPKREVDELRKHEQDKNAEIDQERNRQRKT